MFIILRQVCYRMTIVIFSVFQKDMQCSESYQRIFMLTLAEILLQVIACMTRSCGEFYTSMALRALLYLTVLSKESR